MPLVNRAQNQQQHTLINNASNIHNVQKPINSNQENAATHPQKGLAIRVTNVVNKKLTVNAAQERIALKEVAKSHVNLQQKQQPNSKESQKASQKPATQKASENPVEKPVRTVSAESENQPKRVALRPKVQSKGSTSKSQQANEDKIKKVSTKPINKDKIKVTEKPAASAKQPLQPSKTAITTTSNATQFKATATNNANSNSLDFVIFCDENDQLALTAVEKPAVESQNVKAEIVVLDKENLAVLEKKKQALQQQAQSKVNNKPMTAVGLKESTNCIPAAVAKTAALAVQPPSKVVKPIVVSAVEKKAEPAKVAEVTKAVAKVEAATEVVKCTELKVVEIKAVDVKTTVTAESKTLNEKSTTTVTAESKITIEKSSTTAAAPKVENVEILDEEMHDVDSLVDLLKINESLAAAELTLDESCLEDDDENKENDPSLMSMDTSSIANLSVDPSNHSMETFKLETCFEYADDIYEYMMSRERMLLPSADYMSKQPEVNCKMRSMLVDWLVDVSLEYKLESETVFLAVNYIDRFLSSLTISLSNFQLLGTAALFIASKYEEIYPPDISEFIYITDDAYDKTQMLSMEKLLLKALNFEISSPTAIYFLKKFISDMSLPTYVEHFAEYICFLTLLQCEPFLKYTPSDIAICCLLLSIHTFGIEKLIYMDDFKKCASYHFYKNEKNQLCNERLQLVRQACLNDLYECHKGASTYPQQAVYQKYSTEQFYTVSKTEFAEEPPLIKNMFK